VRDGTGRSFGVHPDDVGRAVAGAEGLKGGDGETNAAAFRAVIGGEKGAYRDIVLMNAGATLVVAGAAEDLRKGVEMAAESIESGKAKGTLAKWIELTNRTPPPAEDGD